MVLGPAKRAESPPKRVRMADGDHLRDVVVDLKEALRATCVEVEQMHAGHQQELQTLEESFTTRLQDLEGKLSSAVKETQSLEAAAQTAREELARRQGRKGAEFAPAPRVALSSAAASQDRVSRKTSDPR